MTPKQRRAVEHARCDAAWAWMYRRRWGRRHGLRKGTVNRSLTTRLDRPYHFTKGWR